MTYNAALRETGPEAEISESRAAIASPKVWILLGDKIGDDNQLRALTDALGWPTETKNLTYNWLQHLSFFRGERLLHLDRKARSILVPPWPDLVIGLGYQSIAAARFIRRQSGGRTRIIQLGNPRTDIRDIDLVIATPQYPLPAGTNLLEIPFPIGNPACGAKWTKAEEEWLQDMPRPRRLVAVGGSTRQWNIDVAELVRSIRYLQQQRARSGGSVVAVTSRRTPLAVARRLEEMLRGDSEACVTSFPRFPVMLAHCDEIHVTADSVSMLAEAALTGKPVGLIPVRRSIRGWASQILRSCGVPLKLKTDMEAFWRHLRVHGLAGSVTCPIASTVAETTATAVSAIRFLLERTPEPKIWALLGARQGDNNQVLALAEALGLPFERKQLTYNRWRHLGPRILGPTLRSLTRISRASMTRDIPDVTISTGHRSVAAVQFLRRRSGGRVRSIHVGYPRISPSEFHLVIATPEYPIPNHPNLVRIPFALTRQHSPAAYDDTFWATYPAPRRLLVLGGPTLYWRLRAVDVSKALDDLLALADANGGSVVVVGSPRTPRRLLAHIDRRVFDAHVPAALVPVGGTPSYAELLDRTDTIAVTADSVAMISEAVATGKPVGLVPVLPTLAGRFLMAFMDRLRPGKRIRPRDLRFFWQTLRDRGFVGSALYPRSAAVPDLNRLVAARARAILNCGPVL